MQDGDIIIFAEFDAETWEVLDLRDRYVLKTVNQVTVRGPGYSRKPRTAVGKPFIVHQETTVDKLPYGHPFYEVPLYFDYNSVDPDITPPDEDPTDPGTVGTYSAVSINVRIRGAEQFFSSSVERQILVDVEGELSSSARDMRIEGEGEGVEFH